MRTGLLVRHVQMRSEDNVEICQWVDVRVDRICNFILSPHQRIHNYLLKALSSPFKMLKFGSMVVHSGILTVLVIITMIMNFTFSLKGIYGLIGISLSYPHTFLSAVRPLYVSQSCKSQFSSCLQRVWSSHSSCFLFTPQFEYLQLNSSKMISDFIS